MLRSRVFGLSIKGSKEGVFGENVAWSRNENGDLRLANPSDLFKRFENIIHRQLKNCRYIAVEACSDDNIANNSALSISEVFMLVLNMIAERGLRLRCLDLKIHRQSMFDPDCLDSQRLSSLNSLNLKTKFKNTWSHIEGLLLVHTIW